MILWQSKSASVRSHAHHVAINNHLSIEKSGSVSRVLCPAFEGGRRPFILTNRCRLALPYGKRPTRRQSGNISRSYSGRVSGLLGLAGGGVYPAGTVTGAAVRSYRTISPLPVPVGTSAVYFLRHFPAGHPGWPLATTVPCPARTFLRLEKEAGDRPTHSF